MMDVDRPKIAGAAARADLPRFEVNPQPPIERLPLPGPDDDVRPRQGMSPASTRYLQGDRLPATSSVLISNSKYLNNPYYREAYASQALRRHGHDLPPTYMVPQMSRAIEEVTDHGRVAELLQDERRRVPALGAWLDRRDDFSFRKDDLGDCGSGTLGRALFDLMSIPGVNMEFASQGQADATDLAYLQKRRAYFHDLEHIVTGFHANNAGEAALAIMIVMQNARFFTPELAQYMSAANMWVTSGGIYRNSLHYHHALPTYLQAVQLGIAAGSALNQPMFLLRWADFIEWRLEDIAAHLGFERGPGDAWEWTTDATNG